MFSQTYNFKQFSDKIYTSGMPTKEQLLDSFNFGVQVVINLAPHTGPNVLSDEKTIVDSLQMEYVNIPVDWNSPTHNELIAFMDLMDNKDGSVIYVHCKANFRASAFVTLYRILRQNCNIQNALQTMSEIWDINAYPIWKEFITEYIEKKEN